MIFWNVYIKVVNMDIRGPSGASAANVAIYHGRRSASTYAVKRDGVAAASANYRQTPEGFPRVNAIYPGVLPL